MILSAKCIKLQSHKNHNRRWSKRKLKCHTKGGSRPTEQSGENKQEGALHIHKTKNKVNYEQWVPHKKPGSPEGYTVPAYLGCSMVFYIKVSLKMTAK